MTEQFRGQTAFELLIHKPEPQERRYMQLTLPATFRKQRAARTVHCFLSHLQNSADVFSYVDRSVITALLFHVAEKEYWDMDDIAVELTYRVSRVLGSGLPGEELDKLGDIPREIGDRLRAFEYSCRLPPPQAPLSLAAPLPIADAAEATSQVPAEATVAAQSVTEVAEAAEEKEDIDVAQDETCESCDRCGLDLTRSVCEACNVAGYQQARHMGCSNGDSNRGTGH